MFTYTTVVLKECAPVLGDGFEHSIVFYSELAADSSLHPLDL